MKNVTPSPGQVWEHKKTNMSCMLNEVNIDYTDPVSLHKHFTFQPQTDLEWLAVSVNFSGMKSNEYARRNTYNKYSIEFWHYREEGCHSYEEIQNMRYELGLDDRPEKTFEDEVRRVTPAAGQVWESGNVNKIIDEVTLSRVFYNGDCWESYNGFIIDNIFVPQSDLDWLAVNVNGVDVRSFYAKDTSSRDGYKVNGKDLIRNYGGKLVQSKQIELGLDEPQQKETKMIDLSSAEVGDDFVDFNDNKIKIVYVNNHAPQRFVGTIDGGSACVYDKHGKNIDKSCVGIVSKIEPRHWLKDLPDADLFKLYQTSDIECNELGSWMANSLGAHTINLSRNKMPKLTGDEYKLSKISIPDLKAWQEKNK